MRKLITRGLFSFAKIKETNPELGMLGQAPDLRGK